MGVIKEFPGLQIDDFRGRPLLALLTHAHSDHLTGLDSKGYRGPAVWCTPTTRSLVLNLRSNNNFTGELKYNHLRKEFAGTEVLQTLPLDMPTQLELGSQQVLVTAIDANHCPGSCMFLIQSSTAAVLYTGDIRCEQWWPDMLRAHPVLLPYTCARQQINVYMDNIYEQHRDHELDYASSTSGISELARLLSRGYPQESHFCALFTTTGYETVLIALSALFKSKIHMDKYYYSLYQSAADSCPTSRALLECSTTDAEARCKLHWCAKGSCTARDRLDSVYFSPCITISRAAVDERNAILDTTGMSVHGKSELPVYVDGTTGARYVKGADMLPGHLLFYFSRHASRPALGRLLEIFTVHTVRSLNGNQMEGFSSFKSSTSEDPTDESLTSLPLTRKQAVKIGNKRKSYSTESSHDEALRFLDGVRHKAEVAGPKSPGPRESQTTPQPKLIAAPEAVPEAAPSPETMETQASLAQMDIKVEPSLAQVDKVEPKPAQVDKVEPKPAQVDKVEPKPAQVDKAEPKPAQTEHTFGLSRFQDIKEASIKQEQETDAVPLETQLRQDESAWFSMRFDWQSQ